MDHDLSLFPESNDTIPTNPNLLGPDIPLEYPTDQGLPILTSPIPLQILDIRRQLASLDTTRVPETITTLTTICESIVDVLVDVCASQRPVYDIPRTIPDPSPITNSRSMLLEMFVIIDTSRGIFFRIPFYIHGTIYWAVFHELFLRFYKTFQKRHARANIQQSTCNINMFMKFIKQLDEHKNLDPRVLQPKITEIQQKIYIGKSATSENRPIGIAVLSHANMEMIQTDASSGNFDTDVQRDELRQVFSSQTTKSVIRAHEQKFVFSRPLFKECSLCSYFAKYMGRDTLNYHLNYTDKKLTVQTDNMGNRMVLGPLKRKSSTSSGRTSGSPERRKKRRRNTSTTGV